MMVNSLNRVTASLLLTIGLAATGCSRTVAPALTQTASVRAADPRPTLVSLPNERDSLKVAVLGDFGTGERSQYALAQQMARVRQEFPYELVLLVGDNIYGSARPRTMSGSSRFPTSRCSRPAYGFMPRSATTIRVSSGSTNRST
jgi:hypothetical protein